MFRIQCSYTTSLSCTSNSITYVGGNSPAARTYSALALSPDQTSLYLTGGMVNVVGSIAYLADDTWRFNLTSNRWTRLSSAYGPYNRYGASMSYLVRQNEFLLYGGREDHCGFRNDTFLFRPATETWLQHSITSVHRTLPFKVGQAVLNVPSLGYLMVGGHSCNTSYTDSFSTYLLDPVTRDRWVTFVISSGIVQQVDNNVVNVTMNGWGFTSGSPSYNQVVIIEAFLSDSLTAQSLIVTGNAKSSVLNMTEISLAPSDTRQNTTIQSCSITFTKITCPFLDVSSLASNNVSMTFVVSITPNITQVTELAWLRIDTTLNRVFPQASTSFTYLTSYTSLESTSIIGTTVDKLISTTTSSSSSPPSFSINQTTGASISSTSTVSSDTRNTVFSSTSWISQSSYTSLASSTLSLPSLASTMELILNAPKSTSFDQEYYLSLSLLAERAAQRSQSLSINSDAPTYSAQTQISYLSIIIAGCAFITLIIFILIYIRRRRISQKKRQAQQASLKQEGLTPTMIQIVAQTSPTDMLNP